MSNRSVFGSCTFCRIIPFFPHYTPKFSFYKTYLIGKSSRTQEGGNHMDDKDFRNLFHRIVNQYTLEPAIAEELLQRILNVLSRCKSSDEYS